jgi:hypothetical protein
VVKSEVERRYGNVRAGMSGLGLDSVSVSGSVNTEVVGNLH